MRRKEAALATAVFTSAPAAPATDALFNFLNHAVDSIFPSFSPTDFPLLFPLAHSKGHTGCVALAASIDEAEEDQKSIGSRKTLQHASKLRVNASSSCLSRAHHCVFCL